MSIPQIRVPSFDLTLPVNHRKIKYRPFLVKEEKILIMASESEGYEDLINAVGDVVRSCTFGAVDADTDPLFEVQHAFLHIRGKSIGETIDFGLICGECNHQLPATVNVDEFTVRTTQGHTPKIDLGNGMGILMRYPTFRHFKILHDSVDSEDVYRVVGECIREIYTDEEVTPAGDSDEMLEFVYSMTPAQMAEVQVFFATMPVLEKPIEFSCPQCNTVNEVVVDGINHFFE
jgi:hypothetical protein